MNLLYIYWCEDIQIITLISYLLFVYPWPGNKELFIFPGVKGADTIIFAAPLAG